MKLLIATGLYPPEIGGPATYAAMLEKRLPEHDVEVKVVPFGWVRGYPKIIRHFVYAWKVFKEEKGFDVVYALDGVSVGLPALLAARLRRKKFMVRLGGDYAWEQGRQRFGLKPMLDDYTNDPKQAPFMVRRLAGIQSFVTKRATRVVLPSEYLKSIVTTWGVKENKTVVVHSALFPLSVDGTKEELRSQLNYIGPTVVYAGRLVPWKGFVGLLEAVAKLKTDIPYISLVIAGEGPERPKIESAIERLNLNDNVRMVGRVSKDALGATIKAADLFVLNSAYEGLSHQLIEVMDLGVPIVTTEAGGNPELIQDGVTGLLVPVNDTEALTEGMKRVLLNTDTAGRMVQSARARAKEFTPDKAIASFIEVLKEVYE